MMRRGGRLDLPIVDGDDGPGQAAAAQIELDVERRDYYNAPTGQLDVRLQIHAEP